MWLFVGLGNPGRKYQDNRHNIGFMAVDEIFHRHNFSGWTKKFHGEIAEGRIGGERVILLKPHTFMNLSGQAVQAATAFYKIPLSHVVVFHDELDLAAGKLRGKTGGGNGGHNGLKSIDAHLGTSYQRVRMGIGHPGDKDLVSPYVLGDFAKADRDWLEKVLCAVSDHAANIIAGDMDVYMTKIAENTQPPKPSKPATAQTEDKKDGI